MYRSKEKYNEYMRNYYKKNNNAGKNVQALNKIDEIVMDIFKLPENKTKRQEIIKSLIELKQYILGTFYQELGIQSQFNMKREAINEAEAALSEDILYPLIDDMLIQRQIGLEKVNKMYGTNITVELSSVWKQLREQNDLQMDLINSEIDKNLGEEVKEDESNK